MNVNEPITTLLKRLWQHITAPRRRQFILLFALMMLVSFAEVLSIGSVLPFLGMLTNPSHIFELPIVQFLVRPLGVSNPNELLFLVTIIFGAAALIAGGLRLWLLWASMRLSYATGADLSISIYRRTLYQPYSVHTSRNSSEIINGISSKSGTIITSLTSVMTLMGSSIILLTILIALLSIDPLVAISAFGSFGLIYLVIIRLTQNKQVSNSKLIAQESTQVIKSLQEGLGGIRDILIDGAQETYCHIYQKADIPLRRAQGNSQFIAQSPRYGMEALGMVVIAVIAFSLAQSADGITRAIPILGTLALGAQRLLPVLQQAYQAWSNIQAQKASLYDALNLLDQPLPDFATGKLDLTPIYFAHEICLRQLSFRYGADMPWVLKDVTLTIPKGGRVGIIGATGSGKSTLLDIVMGLLTTERGVMEIDGVKIGQINCQSWQAHIAHVPQTIFLSDSTVEENIAFGVPKNQIDKARVRLAAEQAHIAASIESWPEKYQTFVGERGIRLSGGQRQRIGIARALYKQADVIIFDEATSALDGKTEEAVMQAIESLSSDLTLIIIAHRITTLRGCTQIIELDGGSVKHEGSYQNILNRLD